MEFDFDCGRNWDLGGRAVSRTPDGIRPALILIGKSILGSINASQVAPQSTIYSYVNEVIINLIASQHDVSTRSFTG